MVLPVPSQTVHATKHFIYGWMDGERARLTGQSCLNKAMDYGENSLDCGHKSIARFVMHLSLSKMDIAHYSH
jgi:hypothetical protein